MVGPQNITHTHTDRVVGRDASAVLSTTTKELSEQDAPTSRSDQTRPDQTRPTRLLQTPANQRLPSEWRRPVDNEIIDSRRLIRYNGPVIHGATRAGPGRAGN